MEHKGWTFNADGSVKSAFGERTDLLSSVAFWYQQGIAQRTARGRPTARAGCRRATRCRSRSRSRSAEAQGREGQGLGVARSSSGRRTCCSSRPRGPGARVEIPFDVPDGRRLRALRRARPGLRLRHLHGAPRRQESRGGGARARAGRGRAAADAVRRLRAGNLRGRRLPGGLAAPHEGPPHADVRLPRQARGLGGLRARRRRLRPGAHRRRGLGRGRRRAGRRGSLREAPPSWPAASRTPTPSRAASPPSRCATAAAPRCRRSARSSRRCAIPTRTCG